MLAALIGVATATGAQESAARACTYESCSFGMTVRWNGLVVVRGPTTERIATLNFFFPRDIGAAFAGGNTLSATWAQRATNRRRVAAVFTDVGLMLMSAALVPAARGKPVEGGVRSAAVLGGALFTLSVPLQFSADNALSKAVWFYNQRFTH